MFCWLLASVFLVTSKGQCILNSQDTGAYVFRCNPSVYKALVIHIDFYEINNPCTCTVTPKFTGNLFVLSKKSTAEKCNTQVKINDDFMFNCTASAGSNHTLHVQRNQIVHVQAEYIKPSKQGMFHQCLQIRQYGGTDGDLSVRCTALTASTARSTTTTKTLKTTATTSTTTKNLKSILTTTTPSIHSRSTSFVEPSTEATVTNNMNTDVITNSKETASVSFSSPTMKTTPDDSQKMIYIIAGFALRVVLILIGLITCVLALTKRGKIERTKDISTEEDSVPTNKNADSSNALRGNPLYVSSDEVEDITCTEEEEEDKQQGDGYSSVADLESNRDHDDGPSINQPVDSVPVFPDLNNSNIGHSRRDVYAQVYKQNKSYATVHDSVQTQNQKSFFYIGVE
ncbi:uncharacterized protein LOC128183853 [Crassostrea angulata]|uniref:uncharacterized protein LOC128183853 n=1 Tax=Magallana angulata TaxID=2784310 RepID=UPI0022B1D5C5|nr:uncharacterized protein LOC128183853 [Crassostrea angulata]